MIKLQLTPQEAKQAIGSFLARNKQEVTEGLALNVPETNAYEFHSGRVIEMLMEQIETFGFQNRDLKSKLIKFE